MVILSIAQPVVASTGKIGTGQALSDLGVLFLLLDVTVKFNPPAVAETSAHIDWPSNLAPVLGVILLGCTALYAIPRTAILGAVLLTGCLVGAVTTHMGVCDPVFTHILFPVSLGVMLWTGLFLRDERTRNLLPL